MDDYLCYIVNNYFLNSWLLLNSIIVSIFQIKLFDDFIGFRIGVRVFNFYFFPIHPKKLICHMTLLPTQAKYLLRKVG